MSDVFNFSRYLTPIACCLEQRRFRELKVISSAELWNIDIFGEELVERLVLWKKFNCIGIIFEARRILIRSIFLNRSCTKTIVIVFKWFAAPRKIFIEVKTEKNLSCLVFHLSMNMHVCKSHFLLDLQLNKQIDNFQKKLEEIEYLSQFTSVKMCAEEGKKRVLNDVRKIKRGTVFPRENVDSSNVQFFTLKISQWAHQVLSIQIPRVPLRGTKRAKRIRGELRSGSVGGIANNFIRIALPCFKTIHRRNLRKRILNSPFL